MDCLDILAVQGTLKSLLQHHSSKATILKHSAFFIDQLSHPYMTIGKTIALTRWTFVVSGRAEENNFSGNTVPTLGLCSLYVMKGDVKFDNVCFHSSPSFHSFFLWVVSNCMSMGSCWEMVSRQVQPSYFCQRSPVTLFFHGWPQLYLWGWHIGQDSWERAKGSKRETETRDHYQRLIPWAFSKKLGHSPSWSSGNTDRVPANLFDVILCEGHQVSYVHNRLAKGLMTDFANKVLFEHSHVHLFMYSHLWLFPCCDCQVKELCQRLFGLQSLKYDLILYIKKVCWLLVYDCCIVVVQLLSRVWLFVASWTVAHQASVHEISQARILEWVAISSSRGSSQPKDWTYVCCIGRRILYHWATREAYIRLK